MKEKFFYQEVRSNQYVFFVDDYIVLRIGTNLDELLQSFYYELSENSIPPRIIGVCDICFTEIYNTYKNSVITEQGIIMCPQCVESLFIRYHHTNSSFIRNLQEGSYE